MRILVSLFDTFAAAQMTVRELIRAGYRREDMCIMARDGQVTLAPDGDIDVSAVSEAVRHGTTLVAVATDATRASRVAAVMRHHGARHVDEQTAQESADEDTDDHSRVGTIAGTAVGAVAGATAGSVAGPGGAVAGSLAGAAAGAGVGAAGDTLGSEAAAEPDTRAEHLAERSAELMRAIVRKSVDMAQSAGATLTGMPITPATPASVDTYVAPADETARHKDADTDQADADQEQPDARS